MTVLHDGKTAVDTGILDAGGVPRVSHHRVP